ncbi:type IV secretion system protein [Aureimonas sp. N4]|uniref:type IV secretion system protein n=1 Tax=Aureimonas sp. N4 TaxID=1638165 RepID=UPI0007833762|nr:type IV secretion system protein [Aureimonas sp. N4]
MIFTTIFGSVEAGLQTYLSDRVAAVIQVVEQPLRIAAVLYIVLFGIAILRGAIDEPFMDFALRAMKIVFIIFLVTTAGYNQYVTGPLFNDLPDLIGNAVSGTTGNVGATFDSLMGRGFQLAKRISDEGGWFEIGPATYSLAVYVAAAIMAAIGFTVATVVKVVLALLVAIGPIFIACALFEATRRFFFGWLSQCVNYIILFALTLAMMELVLSLTNSVYPTLQTYNAQLAGMCYVALSILSLLFFLWAPSIASGIVGGASLGLADFVRPITGAATKAVSGGSRAGGNAPGGGAFKAGRNSRST